MVHWETFFFFPTRLHGSVQQRLQGDNSFPVQPREVVELLQSAKSYMENLKIDKELKELCKVEHDMCAAWALKGGESTLVFRFLLRTVLLTQSAAFSKLQQPKSAKETLNVRLFDSHSIALYTFLLLT